MATDFSYKTDYAKSARSSCRICKSTIDKGELRVAAMVQSRHHDGKDPLWHHVRCFFAKRKAALTVEEIGGVGDLRWEDQETLKGKCGGLEGGANGGEASTSSKGKANGTKPPAPAATPTVTDDYSLLYTKTGSSKCPICEEKIGKSTLAVLRKHGSKEKTHHLSCFADKREEVGFTASMDGKKLPGYKELAKEDQTQVKEKLKATEKKAEAKDSTDKTKKIKNGDKTKIKATNGSGASTSAAADEEMIKLHQQKLYENRDRLTDWDRNQVNEFLKVNGQDCNVESATGVEGVYLRLADIMTFGALRPCKKCNGQYIFRSGIGYECNGNFSEFAKCKDLTLEPARKKLKIPDWAEKLDAFSGSGKKKFTSLYPAKRSFKIMKLPAAGSQASSLAGSSKSRKKGKESSTPWEGNNELRTHEGVRTMTTKGGAVVDADSGMDDYCHVYKEGGTYYNAVMNRIDVETGSNSYYKLQLLEEDKRKCYHVFRSWGRIGTTIGGEMIDATDDLEDAKGLFCKHYAEKCGTPFGQKYQKKPGSYVPMHIEYLDEEKIKKKAPKAIDSKLPTPVQELVSLIFDVERMQDALIQFQINLDEMPLGKISAKQIKEAFTVLGNAQKLLEGSEPAQKHEIVDVTNRFFTYVPHSFGTAAPPLLDNLDLIKRKTEMLESMLEIELAYEILQKDTGKEGSPIDAHYAALKTELDVLDKQAEEFGVIQTYLENTHAETHDAYDLGIKEVFRVVRMGENDRFGKYKDLHNKKLLWHGSRTTNFAGILSQGLRIAPPEAPATGYMFGKGVYFADMVSKSANYCWPSKDGDTGLLLLCEVALGEMHELTGAKESLTKAPKDKHSLHSVKGIGQTQPNPKSKYILPENVEVPYGKPQKYLGRQTSLLYNEYIVYDVAQVNIRYLVEVEFKFKAKRRRV